jgi:hypothetical protein
MPTCNTTLCIDYNVRILGNGTMQNQVQKFWLKAENGQSVGWTNFSEESVRFGITHWIGIQLASGVPNLTEVAKAKLYDCNNALMEQASLCIPTAMSWAKWIYFCNFGTGCVHGLSTAAFGTGTMPDFPPGGH